MGLENNYHGFCQFGKFNLTPLEEMNKRNHFEIGEFWFFSQFCVKTLFLQKSRQSWPDTLLLSCDKLHKGYKNFDFFHETLTIS